MNLDQRNDNLSTIGKFFALIVKNESGISVISNHETLQNMGVTQELALKILDVCQQQFGNLRFSPQVFYMMPIEEIIDHIFELSKKKEIKDRLTNYVWASFESVKTKPTGSDTFRVLRLDSMDIAETMDICERSFGIRLRTIKDSSDFANMTIDQIANYIYQQTERAFVQARFFEMIGIKIGQAFIESKKKGSLRSSNFEKVDAFEVQTICEKGFDIKIPFDFVKFWEMDMDEIINVIFMLLSKKKMRTRMIYLLRAGMELKDWGDGRFKGDITGDTRLCDDLGLKLQDVAAFIKDCSDMFDFVITEKPEVFGKLTVDQIVAYIYD